MAVNLVHNKSNTNSLSSREGEEIRKSDTESWKQNLKKPLKNIATLAEYGAIFTLK